MTRLTMPWHPRQDRHKAVLDHRVGMADSASKNLDENLTPVGHLERKVDQLKRFAFGFLKGRLVSLGKFRRHAF